MVACGGSASLETGDDAADIVGDAGASQPDDVGSVEDLAAANMALLEASDDARAQQVLDVFDGSISSLRDAVDGDRPVLIWFWAPH